MKPSTLMIIILVCALIACSIISDRRRPVVPIAAQVDSVLNDTIVFHHHWTDTFLKRTK